MLKNKEYLRAVKINHGRNGGMGFDLRSIEYAEGCSDDTCKALSQCPKLRQMDMAWDYSVEMLSYRFKPALLRKITSLKICGEELPKQLQERVTCWTV